MKDSADVQCTFASKLKLRQITLGLFVFSTIGLVVVFFVYSQMTEQVTLFKYSQRAISKSIGEFRVNFKDFISNNTLNTTISTNNIRRTVTKTNSPVTINTSVDNILRFDEPPAGLQPCPMLPKNLRGKVPVDVKPENLSEVKKSNPDVRPGGHNFPKDCRARHKVAIIVPYRDRAAHLTIFLRHMHSFLSKQQLDYGIFIIELKENLTFNRAMLMNIGYVEAKRYYDWDCYVFHDVDLIPENDHNFYTCPDSPRHMSVAVSTMNYRLPYESIFGGVTNLKKEHIELVNGFSNVFFGWGGEDDDMWNRISKNHMSVTRYSPGIARYKMLDHKKDKGNPHRVKLLNTGMTRWTRDGLNSLQYFVHSRDLMSLYTRVLVSYDPALEVKAKTLRRLRRL